MNQYSDLEGLRIAIEIERRGREFYRQAGEQATEENHRELFLWLMREEENHVELFTQIYERIKNKKEAYNDEYLFDPDTSRYLTVIAESHIFPSEKAALAMIQELKTVSAILRAAMQAEKDSILFYDELAIHAKFSETRNIFRKLKLEESKHVVKLCDKATTFIR